MQLQIDQRFEKLERYFSVRLVSQAGHTRALVNALLAQLTQKMSIGRNSRKRVFDLKIHMNVALS